MLMKWYFLFHLLCTNGQQTVAYTSIANVEMAKDFIGGVKLIKSFYDVGPGACINWEKYPAEECRLLSIEERLSDEDLLPDNSEFPVWNK